MTKRCMLRERLMHGARELLTRGADRSVSRDLIGLMDRDPYTVEKGLPSTVIFMSMVAPRPMKDRRGLTGDASLRSVRISRTHWNRRHPLPRREAKQYCEKCVSAWAAKQLRQNPSPLPRRRVIPRKDALQAGHRKLFRQKLREHIAEVGGDGQIAVLVELL